MPPSYISGNLLTSSAEITVSTEDSVYVKENLFDGDYSNPFRFTIAAGGSILIDFLTAQTFDAVFIGNHNFDPAATIDVGVGTASPMTSINTPAFIAKNIISKFASQSQRFLEIAISDAGDDITEIGELIVGVRTALPRSFRFGFTPGIQQEAIIERTNRGKRYALELFELVRRQYTFRFPLSEKAQFLAFWTAVNGSLNPFVWLENNAEADPAEALYMSIANQGFVPEEMTDGEVFDWTLSLIEEGLGAEIAT